MNTCSTCVIQYRGRMRQRDLDCLLALLPPGLTCRGSFSPRASHESDYEQHQLGALEPSFIEPNRGMESAVGGSSRDPALPRWNRACITHLDGILGSARVLCITGCCPGPQPGQLAVECPGLCFFLPKTSLDALDIFLADRGISAPLRVAAVHIGFGAEPALRLRLGAA